MNTENKAPLPNIVDILARIAEVTQAGTDADLARELNVSGQVLYGWKNRNTIPWEKLWELSNRTNISMTYWLTGEFELEHYVPLGDGMISPTVFEVIGASLLDAAREAREEEGKEFESFLTGPGIFHVAALIYNKIIKILPQDQIWIPEIDDEAKYAVSLARRAHKEYLKETGGAVVQTSGKKKTS